LHRELADVEERRNVQQQRDHHDGAADAEEPGHEGPAEPEGDQRGRERDRHDDACRRERRRVTTGHVTTTADTASSTALTGRVRKTLTSLAWATMDVRKYCSAIGPRMMPITSGGIGRSYRRMMKPSTPNSIVSHTSARSLRSANAPRKQNTTMNVFRMAAGTFISIANDIAATKPSAIIRTLTRIIPAKTV